MAKSTTAKDAKSTDLKSTLDRLNKEYGEGSVVSLNDKNVREYDVIPSGSLGFDYKVLGVGGWVRGKLYELLGWEGSGKSTLCGHATANCQIQGGKVLYIDSEHAFDKHYFQSLGVNLDELLLCQPNDGEEGFTIALDLIRTGEISLVIIDSDNGLLPKKVAEGEIGDAAIGRKATLNGSSYPKLKSAAHANNVCIIVVSQYREKIGVMFGDPKTTQGGHVLKFYTDCRIEVSKTLGKEGTVVVSNITKVKTIKNKMYPPYRSTTFEVVFGKGIDSLSELLNLMHLYGIGKRWGSSFTVGDDKYKIEELEEFLSEHSDLYDDWRSQVIECIKNDSSIISEE